MIPVQQRIAASGTDGVVPGDSVKCCIASILELPYEDVPHFVNREVLDDAGKPLWWYEGVNTWLKRRGYPLWLKQWSNNRTAAEIFELRKERGLQPGEHHPAILNCRARPIPDRIEGWWIASVISENFEDSTHAIVMLNDQVAFDPSLTPRRTPYEFIGGECFVAIDPAQVRRHVDGWKAMG